MNFAYAVHRLRELHEVLGVDAELAVERCDAGFCRHHVVLVGRTATGRMLGGVYVIGGDVADAADRLAGWLGHLSAVVGREYA